MGLQENLYAKMMSLPEFSIIYMEGLVQIFLSNWMKDLYKLNQASATIPDKY